MAKVYFITGSLGAGKTLCSVDMARKYLDQGRRVATNVNLNLEYLRGPDDKSSRVMRVPDAPTIDDLRAIGLGSADSADNTHGLLLLDELGTWFNARDFTNKGRLAVIKWMIHMRKRRWDVAFLVQDFTMVDKQARGNIAQFLVLCKSSRDFWLFKLLPKFHIANVVHTSTKAKAENWFYKGRDIFPAYDTEQIYFTVDDGDDDMAADADVEMADKERHYRALNGLYSLLPTAYLGDDIREKSRAHFARLNKGRGRVVMSVLAGFVVVAVVLLWPSSDQPVSADVHEIGSAPAPVPHYGLPPANPLSEVLSGFRITGYSQIGDKHRYVFETPSGRVTSDQLISQGYQVRPRGQSEALIVDQEYNFLGVFR